jgi:cupin superfamily acireductone dioxygenase involved in methionine salvage
MPGLRVKMFNDGNSRVRLAEMSAEFIEPSWCERGHIGFVLEGELEIDFQGTIVRYPKGHGISIPQGVAHRHKARSITPITTLFLVDDL